MVSEEDHDAVLDVVDGVERVLVADAAAAERVVEAALRFWNIPENNVVSKHYKTISGPLTSRYNAKQASLIDDHE